MSNIDAAKQKEFFDREKNQYEEGRIVNPPLHTRRELKLMFQKLNHLQRDTLIADFGAGSGRFTIPLLKEGFSVLAVDISNDSLVSLQQTVAKLNLPTIETNNTLPQNQTLSAIVGTDTLHHIDLDEYLPILFSSLKIGGTILFSEPGAYNLAWYIYLPIHSTWEVEKGMLQCRYGNLRRKLTEYGFRAIQITGLGLLPRPLCSWSTLLCQVNDRLGDAPILRLFAYRYIIHATK